MKTYIVKFQHRKNWRHIVAANPFEAVRKYLDLLNIPSTWLTNAGQDGTGEERSYISRDGREIITVMPEQLP